MTSSQPDVNIQIDDLKSSKKKGDDIVTNSKMLRELIDKKGFKLKFIAEKLGLSPYGLQLKIDNKQEFKTSEVAVLCEVLEINSLKKKEEIFFAQQVD